MLAYGKNMGYWLEKGIIYYGDKWGNNAHESHGLTRRLCATGMATGSVALIYTNAMRGGYDDNRDNLKLSFAGATEMPRNIIAHELLGNIFFAHELHELTRRLCDTGMATGSVALIYTNAMMGGYDDNGDNLGQLEVVFCGRNGNASKYYCPRIIGKYFFCPRIARIDTKAMR